MNARAAELRMARGVMGYGKLEPIVAVNKRMTVHQCAAWWAAKIPAQNFESFSREHELEFAKLHVSLKQVTES